MNDSNCELCTQAGGEVIFRCDHWRVVQVNDPQYPGFCRVIWNDHKTEMTALDGPDRAALMEVVFIIEEAVRDVMQPHNPGLTTSPPIPPIS